MDKIYAILVAAALTSHAGTLKPAKRHDVPALFMYMYKVIAVTIFSCGGDRLCENIIIASEGRRGSNQAEQSW